MCAELNENWKEGDEVSDVQGAGQELLFIWAKCKPHGKLKQEPEDAEKLQRDEVREVFVNLIEDGVSAVVFMSIDKELNFYISLLYEKDANPNVEDQGDSGQNLWKESSAVSRS